MYGAAGTGCRHGHLLIINEMDLAGASAELAGLNDIFKVPVGHRAQNGGEIIMPLHQVCFIATGKVRAAVTKRALSRCAPKNLVLTF